MSQFINTEAMESAAYRMRDAAIEANRAADALEREMQRAEAAEARVIHLEQTVGNHECALRAMDAVKAKMEARVKELEEHLKGTMRAGGFDYFSELVVLANRRTHNATYVAEQAQKKVSELEAALEMGQRNCDDVYNDLRAEREAAKRLASQLAAQLAECAGYIASVRTDRQITRDGDIYALQTLEWAEGAVEIAEKANAALESYDAYMEGERKP